MLTPSFNVSQAENCISLTLRVPYVKVNGPMRVSARVPLICHAQISEADVYFEGSCFKFYCKPYFLHLQLPGKLADNGHAKSSYNVETGVCVCVWVELKLHVIGVVIVWGRHCAGGDREAMSWGAFPQSGDAHHTPPTQTQAPAQGSWS